MRSDDVVITKKYKNYPNMMFVNEDTLSKLKMFQIDLKIFLKIRTLKEVKIVVCNDIPNNEVYFYINRFRKGEILKFDILDLLK